MRYAFIHEHEPMYNADHLCDVLEVSRSGYYAWLSREVSERKQRHAHLLPLIKEAFEQSRQTYGYRRIHSSLKQEAGKHQIARLMRAENIVPKTQKRFKVTTHSKHSYPVHANTLDRQFTAAEVNQRWASDITYIPSQEGWLYLAVVMDLFSRKIVGWSLDSRMNEPLVTNALKMALFRRKVTSGLLIHSDRGSQYASYFYQRMLKDHGITCSMSRKGNCWDNAPMESFFRSLKVESIYGQSFKTRDEAKGVIFDYIEVFYNRQRKHSGLNYLAPAEFERAAGIF